jgi:hypothetical protein
LQHELQDDSHRRCATSLAASPTSRAVGRPAVPPEPARRPECPVVEPSDQRSWTERSRSTAALTSSWVRGSEVPSGNGSGVPFIVRFPRETGAPRRTTLRRRNHKRRTHHVFRSRRRMVLAGRTPHW